MGTMLPKDRANQMSNEIILGINADELFAITFIAFAAIMLLVSRKYQGGDDDTDI